MNEKELEKEITEITKYVKSIFPNFNLGVFRGTSINGEEAKGTLEFILNQKSLNDSIYFESLHKQYIHFTSLDVLCNILNENVLRLYNLQNKNDEDEFKYIFNMLNIKYPKAEIDLFRHSLHTFSLCKYSNENRNNLKMWEKYGHKGNGIAIVLELLNTNWYYFILGQVVYDQLQENKIRLYNLLKYFELKKESINSPRLPILIGMIALLNKSVAWKEENEFKLMSYLEYDYDSLFIEEDMLHSLGKSHIKFTTKEGKINSYIELYLDNKIQTLIESKNNVQNNYIPRFKIKSIILGENVSTADYENLIILKYHYNIKNSHKIESIEKLNSFS